MLHTKWVESYKLTYEDHNVKQTFLCDTLQSFIYLFIYFVLTFIFFSSLRKQDEAFNLSTPHDGHRRLDLNLLISACESLAYSMHN